MTMIKAGKASSPAPEAPAPEAAAEPSFASNPAASENARFEGQQVQRPDFVPEKFWKDGKVDLESAFKSYNELETRFTTKTEDLLKQLDAERRKGVPEDPAKYEVSLGDDAPIAKEDLEAHPALDWWRQTAFEAGLPPEKFSEGLNQLIGVLTQGPDLEAEMKSLGENGEARIHAVSSWAQKTFSDPNEFAEIQRIGMTAGGIRILEKLMGNVGPSGGDEVPAPKQVSIDDLRKMQNDPRYWNPTQRDPAFVRQVDEGFQKLFGQKK